MRHRWTQSNTGESLCLRIGKVITNEQELKPKQGHQKKQCKYETERTQKKKKPTKQQDTNDDRDKGMQKAVAKTTLRMPKKLMETDHNKIWKCMICNPTTQLWGQCLGAFGHSSLISGPKFPNHCLQMHLHFKELVTRQKPLASKLQFDKCNPHFALTTCMEPKLSPM